MKRADLEVTPFKEDALDLPVERQGTPLSFEMERGKRSRKGKHEPDKERGKMKGSSENP